MPRQPRNEIEPGIWHVWIRGNNRERVFRDRRDCLIYLAALGTVVADKGWRCMGYCLMVNHVHLLIETVRPNLSAGMGWLHGRYATQHNVRHGRTNHLFGERFGSKRVTTDEQLWAVSRYIALNPVAAGLCDEPRAWRWSSYAAIHSASLPRWLDVARLAEYLGGLRGYFDLVEAGADLG